MHQKQFYFYKEVGTEQVSNLTTGHRVTGSLLLEKSRAKQKRWVCAGPPLGTFALSIAGLMLKETSLSGF